MVEFDHVSGERHRHTGPARSLRRADYLITTFAPLFIQRSRLHAEVLRIISHASDRRFTNFHRVLSRASWSARNGSRILLGHLVQAFAPHGPVIVGLDRLP